MEPKDFEIAMQSVKKFASILAKDNKIDLGKGQFTIIVPFDNHQALIVHPYKKALEVDIKDNVFIANKLKLDSFNTPSGRRCGQDCGLKHGN